MPYKYTNEHKNRFFGLINPDVYWEVKQNIGKFCRKSRGTRSTDNK